jgi:5-formyltetrahydrofolate cyclo-ligase
LQAREDPKSNGDSGPARFYIRSQTPFSMPFSPSKDTIRKEAIERRAKLKALGAELSLKLSRNFAALIPIPSGAVVSSYYAIGDEAVPGALESELRRRGHAIVLPRVAGRNLPLDFHLWEEGAQLHRGGFGLSEPSRDWPMLAPDVLIVPLLAFDRQGYRIGYGAGYYDRTIRGLRDRKDIIAAGFAFSIQEFEAVPHLEYDERLDWVVTETGALRVRN